MIPFVGSGSPYKLSDYTQPLRRDRKACNRCRCLTCDRSADRQCTLTTPPTPLRSHNHLHSSIRQACLAYRTSSKVSCVGGHVKADLAIGCLACGLANADIIYRNVVSGGWGESVARPMN